MSACVAQDSQPSRTEFQRALFTVTTVAWPDVDSATIVSLSKSSQRDVLAAAGRLRRFLLETQAHEPSMAPLVDQLLLRRFKDARALSETISGPEETIELFRLTNFTLKPGLDEIEFDLLLLLFSEGVYIPRTGKAIMRRSGTSWVLAGLQVDK